MLPDMKEVRSYVKRNSRLTDSHKSHLEDHHGFLYTTLPLERLESARYVGLEIGFGTGDSLLDVAKQHPDQLWVGVEVYEIGIASVIRQAKAQALENIILLNGDALLLTASSDQGLFDHVRIFFPDPWPKKKHHKRRLVNPENLDHFSSIIKPGGVLHFATDHLGYAEDCQLYLTEHPAFGEVGYMLERPETKFARKATEKGAIITDLIAERI